MASGLWLVACGGGSRVLHVLQILCVQVAAMTNKSRGDVAYTVIDVAGDVTDELIAQINEGAEVLNARVIL